MAASVGHWRRLLVSIDPDAFGPTREPTVQRGRPDVVPGVVSASDTGPHPATHTARGMLPSGAQQPKWLDMAVVQGKIQVPAPNVVPQHAMSGKKTHSADTRYFSQSEACCTTAKKQVYAMPKNPHMHHLEPQVFRKCTRGGARSDDPTATNSTCIYRLIESLVWHGPGFPQAKDSTLWYRPSPIQQHTLTPVDQGAGKLVTGATCHIEPRVKYFGLEATTSRFTRILTPHQTSVPVTPSQVS